MTSSRTLSEESKATMHQGGTKSMTQEKARSARVQRPSWPSRLGGSSVLLFLLLLGGCSLVPKEPSQQELALACELTKCFCKGERPSLFSKVPTAAALFRSDGAAYCPPGFALAKGTPEDAKDRRY
jgi:hypothetical protein